MNEPAENLEVPLPPEYLADAEERVATNTDSCVDSHDDEIGVHMEEKTSIIIEESISEELKEDTKPEQNEEETVVEDRPVSPQTQLSEQEAEEAIEEQHNDVPTDVERAEGGTLENGASVEEVPTKQTEQEISSEKQPHPEPGSPKPQAETTQGKEEEEEAQNEGIIPSKSQDHMQKLSISNSEEAAPCAEPAENDEKGKCPEKSVHFGEDTKSDKAPNEGTKPPLVTSVSQHSLLHPSESTLSASASAIEAAEAGATEAVRVHFMNGRYKTVLVHSSVTAAELEQIVSAKIELQYTSVFCLWIVGSGLEIPLNPEECPVDMLENWETLKDQYTYAEEDEERAHLPQYQAVPRLQYRVRDILQPHVQIRDPVAIMLLYFEACFYVLNSIYPVTMDDAVLLSAYQLRITYGPYSEDVWRPGFVSNELSQYIPRLLRPKLKPQQWEEAVVGAYKGLNPAHKTHIAQLLYLSVVRRLPFYGGKFFFGAQIMKSSMKIFKKRMPKLPSDRKVVVAVCPQGLFIFNRKTMEVAAEVGFESIASWDAEDWMVLLEVRVAKKKTLEFVIETAEGLLLDEIIEKQVAANTARQNEIEDSIRKEFESNGGTLRRRKKKPTPQK